MQIEQVEKAIKLVLEAMIDPSKAKDAPKSVMALLFPAKKEAAPAAESAGESSA
jgi:hypothetical protein